MLSLFLTSFQQLVSAALQRRVAVLPLDVELPMDLLNRGFLLHQLLTQLDQLLLFGLHRSTIDSQLLLGLSIKPSSSRFSGVQGLFPVSKTAPYVSLLLLPAQVNFTPLARQLFRGDGQISLSIRLFVS